MIDFRKYANAANAHFSQCASRRPTCVFITVLAFPIALVAISVPLGVLPPIETDINAHRYLQADGQRRDDYLAMQSAFHVEKTRRAVEKDKQQQAKTLRLRRLNGFDRQEKVEETPELASDFNTDEYAAMMLRDNTLLRELDEGGNQTASVTCNMVVGDYIYAVWYDGVNITDQLTKNIGDLWSTITFTYVRSAALTIVCSDKTNHMCAHGGFACRCKSTDPRNPFHYAASEPTLWSAYGAPTAIVTDIPASALGWSPARKKQSAVELVGLALDDGRDSPVPVLCDTDDSPHVAFRFAPGPVHVTCYVTTDFPLTGAWYNHALLEPQPTNGSSLVMVQFTYAQNATLTLAVGMPSGHLCTDADRGFAQLCVTSQVSNPFHNLTSIPLHWQALGSLAPVTEEPSSEIGYELAHYRTSVTVGTGPVKVLAALCDPNNSPYAAFRFAPDMVTHVACYILANDYVKRAWYAHRELHIENNFDHWRRTKRVSFEYIEGASLTITVADHSTGLCDGGGFAIRCVSSDVHNPFHQLDSDIYKWISHGSSEDILEEPNEDWSSATARRDGKKTALVVDGVLTNTTSPFLCAPSNTQFAAFRFTPGLLYAGRDCWSHCAGRDGQCAWCGEFGKCCRKNFRDSTNGCALDEGADGFHTCVAGYCADDPTFTDVRGHRCKEFQGKCDSESLTGTHNYTLNQVSAVLEHCKLICNSCFACKDTPHFEDANGFRCAEWRDQPCNEAARHFGYSEVQQAAIMYNCKESCHTCGIVCADNPSFSDARGLTCEGWKNQACANAQETLGYTATEQRDIQSNCKKACNICGLPPPTSPPAAVSPIAERYVEATEEPTPAPSAPMSAATPAPTPAIPQCDESTTKNCLCGSDDIYCTGVKMCTNGRCHMPSRWRSTWDLMLIYKSKDQTSLLTDRKIQLMREVEQGVRRLPSYHKLCLRGYRDNNLLENALNGEMYSDECDVQQSALNYFYGDKAHSVRSGVEYTIVPSATNTAQLPTSMIIDRFLELDVGRVFMDHAWNSTTSSSRTVKHMKSMFVFGTPHDEEWDPQSMRVAFFRFVKDEVMPYMQDMRDKYDDDDLVISWWAHDSIPLQVKQIVFADSCWAIGSLILIWIYITIQTRSFFLATTALGLVMISFPISITVWALIVQPEEFAVINILAFFVIIGIAADNVFILSDLWNQSAVRISEIATLSDRIEWTLYRGGRAIFICSFTTAASFFANMASSVHPVREFGAFLGISVVGAFLLIVLCFPSCLILHETFFKNQKGPMSICAKRNANKDWGGGKEQKEKETQAITMSKSGKGPTANTYSEAWFNVGAMERFFYNTFFHFITKRRLALSIGSVTLVIGALIAVVCTVEVSRVPPELFPEDHNLVTFKKHMEEFSNQFSYSRHAQEPLLICNGCQWIRNDPTASGRDLWRFCISTGPDCSLPSCQRYDTTCSGYGRCEQNGLCSCNTGRGGWDCSIDSPPEDEIESDACQNGDPGSCSHRGKCVKAECWCDEGFTGSKCKFLVGSRERESCEWAPWRPWSFCTNTCGRGEQERHRGIRKGSYWSCRGSNIEHQGCYHLEECFVNCHWSIWSEWSVCDEPCGVGQKRRERRIRQENRGTGKQCEGTSVESVDCNVVPCANQCSVTEWTPLKSECHAPCGDGFRHEIRRRSVVDGESADCVLPARMDRSVPCLLALCPQVCKFDDWVPMEKCSKPCGTGTRTEKKRALIVGCESQIRVVKCNVLQCSCKDDADKLRQLVAASSCAPFAGRCDKFPHIIPFCREACQKCTVCDYGHGNSECHGSKCESSYGRLWFENDCTDCACVEEPASQCRNFGEWGMWSECSVPCGTGTWKRVRGGTQMHGGVPCTEEAIGVCNMRACTPDDCDYDPWSQWSECDEPCGTGTQSRTRKVPDMAWCTEMHQRSSCINKPCDAHCGVSDWHHTSGCSTTCGDGVIQSTRTIESEEGATGCPIRTTFFATCNIGNCKKNCKLSDEWATDGRCSATCGVGKRLWRKEMLVQGSDGGVLCPSYDDIARVRWEPCHGEPCPKSAAVEVYFELDNWTLLNAWQRNQLSVLTSRFLSVPADQVEVFVGNFAGKGFRFKAQIVPVRIHTDQVQAQSIIMKVLDFVNSPLFVNAVISSEISLNHIGLHRPPRVVDPSEPILFFTPLSMPLSMPPPEYIVVNTPKRGRDSDGGSGHDDDDDDDNDRNHDEDDEDREDWRDPRVRHMHAFLRIRGTIIWGVEGSSGKTPKNPLLLDDLMDDMNGAEESLKIPKYRESFSMTSVMQQVALLRFCEEIPDEFVVSRDCALDDFRKELHSRRSSAFPVRNETLMFDEFYSFITRRRGGMYWWISANAGFDIERRRITWFAQHYNFAIRKRAAARHVNSFLEELQKYIEPQLQKMPEGLRVATITGREFVRADAEIQIVHSTMVCALISWGMSLVSVLLFTLHMRLALLVSFNLFSIVTMIAFCMFVVFGWPLSALEALSLIIIVGFSVDYGVHLAESYNQSDASSSSERLREALAQTGVSIMSACLTTIGSALFLFGCTIKAMMQLGMVIFACSLLSCTFTLFVMAPLLIYFGPKGPKARISPYRSASICIIGGDDFFDDEMNKDQHDDTAVDVTKLRLPPVSSTIASPRLAFTPILVNQLSPSMLGSPEQWNSAVNENEINTT